MRLLLIGLVIAAAIVAPRLASMFRNSRFSDSCLRLEQSSGMSGLWNIVKL
jgi:hypothetical protein